MALEVFTVFFAAEMIRLLELSFQDTSWVESYASVVAKFYWGEPSCREQGPGACAEEDFFGLQIERPLPPEWLMTSDRREIEALARRLARQRCYKDV